jgi:hypothetical protein
LRAARIPRGGQFPAPLNNCVIDDCLDGGQTVEIPPQPGPKSGSEIFAFCLENPSLSALCENSVVRRPRAAAGPQVGIFMPLGGYPAMRICLLIFCLCGAAALWYSGAGQRLLGIVAPE